MPSNHSPSRPYRGRFAPSPTGELHFGSLVAAVASFLEARRNEGQWLVRIEDIDPPREVEGSAQRIIQDLERLGMTSDEEVLYQSTRFAAYDRHVESLLERGHAYRCGCSRSDLPPSGIYPGTCRDGIPAGRKPRSVRLRTDGSHLTFQDRIQGELTLRADRPGGDFVIKRADGLPAYQLAVVVDDGHQKISDVVRGVDLLDSTPRQILLQNRLKLERPGYAHLPLAVDGLGKKLSKRLESDPVSAQEPFEAVSAALRFLGQEPPKSGSLESLWDWAIEAWSIGKVPRAREVACL